MTFGTQICGECGHHFCEECVVFPFGPKKAPICISCALELGGVSSRPTGRPKLSRQSIRERRGAQRRVLKSARGDLGSDRSETSVGTPDVAADSSGEGSDSGDAPVSQHWINDSEDIETVPGGWSQTFR